MRGVTGYRDIDKESDKDQVEDKVKDEEGNEDEEGYKDKEDDLMSHRTVTTATAGKKLPQQKQHNSPLKEASYCTSV